MTIGRPFNEFELAYRQRLQPKAFLHLLGGQPFAPAAASCLREVGERACLGSQGLEASE